MSCHAFFLFCCLVRFDAFCWNMRKGHQIDGDSLLCLLRDSSGKGCKQGAWRQWIDMEHDICYNETNHWNGLTDGKIKYVFKAWNASEQLFDLTSDPYEVFIAFSFI